MEFFITKNMFSCFHEDIFMKKSLMENFIFWAVFRPIFDHHYLRLHYSKSYVKNIQNTFARFVGIFSKTKKWNRRYTL